MRIMQLPDINIVDFSNPSDIGGFVSLLYQTAGSIGMTSPGFKHTRESNEIRSLANKAVRKLDDYMPRMSAADALITINPYDFAHRLAYSTPADRKIRNGYVLKAFDAMIHGDKTVDEYAMFREIRLSVSNRDKSYYDKPLYWNSISLERWHKEATRGYKRSGLSDYDIINRVSILLESDLMAFEGSHQASFKIRLFEQHRHYLDSHTATDWQMLNTMSHLVNSSATYLSPADYHHYLSLLNTTNHPNYDRGHQNTD